MTRAIIRKFREVRTPDKIDDNIIKKLLPRLAPVTSRTCRLAPMPSFLAVTLSGALSAPQTAVGLARGDNMPQSVPSASESHLSLLYKASLISRLLKFRLYNISLVKGCSGIMRTLMSSSSR